MTITRYAYARIAEGKPMPGVIEVTSDAPIGRVIEDIILLLSCSLDGELEGQIFYLPL